MQTITAIFVRLVAVFVPAVAAVLFALPTALPAAAESLQQQQDRQRQERQDRQRQDDIIRRQIEQERTQRQILDELRKQNEREERREREAEEEKRAEERKKPRHPCSGLFGPLTDACKESEAFDKAVVDEGKMLRKQGIDFHIYGKIQGCVSVHKQYGRDNSSLGNLSRCARMQCIMLINSPRFDKCIAGSQWALRRLGFPVGIAEAREREREREAAKERAREARLPPEATGTAGKAVDKGVKAVQAESLKIAVKIGYLSEVRRLLAAGADVNAVDSDGKTALDWAKEKGHTEIVKILKAAGAKE